MKHYFQKPGAITVILLAILIQLSCHENVLINSKISPPANQIVVYSTSLPCITHTYYSDSAITSTNIGGIPIYQAIGAITDPYFGTMTGATYFQVIPGGGIYEDWNDSLLSTTTNTFDSAVLVLPYSGFTYGDTVNSNVTQTYQVFLMTDTLGDPVNENYYSNSTKSIDLAFPLSDPTTVNIYHLRDSFGLNVLDENHAGLRIPLKLPLLLQRLNPAITSINLYSTTLAQDFESIFKGICVRTADTRQSANALPYFQLDGSTPYSMAGIILYYHTAGTVATADTFFNFSFSTQFCSHFNNISRSYSHYPVNNLIQTQESDIVALQNQPGASIDVVIPGIKSLPAGVINKAELRFTLLQNYNSIYGTNDTLFPPLQLYPIGIASATYPVAGIGQGVAYNIADRYPVYSTSPLIMIDGYLHNNVDSINSVPLQTFTVDIPREVMYSIANNNDTIHLHINGTQDYYGAFHLVAGGGNYGINGTSDTLYRAKLVVTYSQLTKH